MKRYVHALLLGALCAGSVAACETASPIEATPFSNPQPLYAVEFFIDGEAFPAAVNARGEVALTVADDAVSTTVTYTGGAALARHIQANPGGRVVFAAEKDARAAADKLQLETGLPVKLEPIRGPGELELVFEQVNQHGLDGRAYSCRGTQAKCVISAEIPPDISGWILKLIADATVDDERVTAVIEDVVELCERQDDCPLTARRTRASCVAIRRSELKCCVDAENVCLTKPVDDGE